MRYKAKFITLLKLYCPYKLGQYKVFTEDEYTRLRQVTERRNFWCHCCYYEMSFDMKTGGPAKVSDIHTLFEDMKTAEQWREQLFHKKIALLEKKRQS